MLNLTVLATIRRQMLKQSPGSLSLMFTSEILVSMQEICCVAQGRCRTTRWRSHILPNYSRGVRCPQNPRKAPSHCPFFPACLSFTELDRWEQDFLAVCTSFYELFTFFFYLEPGFETLLCPQFCSWGIRSAAVCSLVIV